MAFMLSEKMFPTFFNANFERLRRQTYDDEKIAVSYAAFQHTQSF